MQAWAVPTCGEVQNYWYGKYLKDFSVTWDTTTFVCPGNEARFALALYDIEMTTFRPNSSGYSPDFYRLVFDNVVHFNGGANCTSGILAYTHGSDINLCAAFFADSREDRASTIIHETRHTQADDPRHVMCVGGPYNGAAGACDNTFEHGTWGDSGYNADIFFLSWVVRSGQGNELSKSVAQSVINSMIPDRFNNITDEEISAWRD